MHINKCFHIRRNDCLDHFYVNFLIYISKELSVAYSILRMMIDTVVGLHKSHVLKVETK
jgi:hypothetical protein